MKKKKNNQASKNELQNHPNIIMCDAPVMKISSSFIRQAIKDKKEVDFLVTKEGKPWFLVEVKSSAKHAISKHLYWFQEKTGAQHAFQVVMDLPFVDADCFAHEEPIKIPVESLLMRLV